jgi:hypothetical protein
MDDTAVRTAPPRRARRRGAGCIGGFLNLLTAGLVLLTCLVVGVFAVLYTYPHVLAFVPGGSAFMPPTAPATALALALITPLPTVTAGGSTGPSGDLLFPTLPPEWTATAAPTHTPTPRPATATPLLDATAPPPTRTPRLSATSPVTPTRTPSRTPAGPTPVPTNTRSAFSYTLQTGSPAYLSNFLNNAGCNWFGIAGRAFDLADRAVIGLTVRAWADQTELPAQQTGSAPQIGTGGYEVYLSDHPIESTNVYQVQLFNNTGTALSQQYTIRTYGDCTRNLVMVNFVQNH